MGDAEPGGERLLERGDAGPERELPRAQHLEDELGLALAEHGPGERDDVEVGRHARATGGRAAARGCSA